MFTGQPATQGILAVEAASGLLHGHLSGIALGHLLKIAAADGGVLLRHGEFGRTHIRHRITPQPPFCISRGMGPAGLRFALLISPVPGHQLVKIHFMPVKSRGPSTQANFISPPTGYRQPPHIPVPSIMMGLRRLSLDAVRGSVVLQTHFIMMIGPIAMTASVVGCRSR